MHIKNSLYYIFVFISFFGNTQNSLDDLLKKYNSKTIPYISVETLAMPKVNAIVFDSRETEEYTVSHIKNAINVGYNNFNIESILRRYPNKQQKIVVYCSLGIRSETIGEKLKKEGYKNVYNLYGGIFEWKNKGFSVLNFEETETQKIHVFNKQWSKWLKKGKKVFKVEEKKHGLIQENKI